jgi:transcriptional regulator GlxA family with amidase domain
VVSAALDYIWTRSHQVLAVSTVATAVGTTRRTLERRMKAVLGRSVLDEIITSRFGRAERLLRETDLPIKTVVDLAGFGSAENMRQVFLAKTGCSPADFRKNAPPGRGGYRQGKDGAATVAARVKRAPRASSGR